MYIKLEKKSMNGLCRMTLSYQVAPLNNAMAYVPDYETVKLIAGVVSKYRVACTFGIDYNNLRYFTILGNYDELKILKEQLESLDF